MEQILGPLLARAARELDDPQRLQRTLGAVLERAARRALGGEADVEIDPHAGTIDIMAFRRVVDGPADPDEIELHHARSVDPDAQPGDELGCSVELDALAPYLRAALLVPAEIVGPIESFLTDLLWDREVLLQVPRRPADLSQAIARLVEDLRASPFASRLRPGCDAVELEAHEMMLGGLLPRGPRELLGAIGGMSSGDDERSLCLGVNGFRLLSPLEAQREHAEWTRRRELLPPRSAVAPGQTHPARAWNTDWLPLAVGSRGAESTALLVVDPLGATADRPGELLCISFEEAGWWVLGTDVAGLAHVWSTLHEHGLLVYQVPGEGDPIVAGKAAALTEHLLPERRWVEAR